MIGPYKIPTISSRRADNDNYEKKTKRDAEIKMSLPYLSGAIIGAIILKQNSFTSKCCFFFEQVKECIQCYDYLLHAHKNIFVLSC
jgi:hypothetical protein